MKQKKSNNKEERMVTLDGLLTIGKSEINALKFMEFMCCEDVNMEAFVANFKVQGMRDGNIYMSELPKKKKHKKGKASFRDDNSTLTLGDDGNWYFWFSLPDSQIARLPEQLVRQASAIAQKVLRELVLHQK